MGFVIQILASQALFFKEIVTMTNETFEHCPDVQRLLFVLEHVLRLS